MTECIEIDTSALTECLEAIEDMFTPEQMGRVMRECGNVVQTQASMNSPIDIGHLRSNIEVRDSKEEGDGNFGVTVGVHGDTIVAEELMYAIYLEYGTGIYAEGGNGRKTPWRWVGKTGKWTGKGFTTRGMPARPYLRPAFDNNVDKFETIISKRIEQALNGGY